MSLRWLAGRAKQRASIIPLPRRYFPFSSLPRRSRRTLGRRPYVHQCSVACVYLPTCLLRAAELVGFEALACNWARRAQSCLAEPRRAAGWWGVDWRRQWHAIKGSQKRRTRLTSNSVARDNDFIKHRLTPSNESNFSSLNSHRPEL